MAFSSGTFSRLHDWTTDRDAGIKISASRTDAEFDGIATGLTTCILKDGTQTLTAMIPFTLGLSVPTDKKIQLRDSAIFINSSADGQLNVAADTSVTITTPSLIVSGGAVFNEDSADVDFRVEGNGDANALFVEGETDNVGIGNNDPADKLHVYLGSGQRVARFEANSSTSAHIAFKASDTSLMPTVGVKDEDLYFSTGDAVEAFRIDANGHVTMPLQSAFLARPTSSQTNIALNTAVTVVLGTEVFDNNGDFSSNTFTAPVAGRYQLNMHVLLAQLDAGHTFSGANIITSNRNYQFTIDNAADFSQDFSQNPYSACLSVLADMDASDTAHLTVQCQGGTQQTDINTGTSFSGYLVA